jgi:hypothetical protein
MKLLELVNFRCSPEDKKVIVQAALMMSIEMNRKVDAAELYRKAIAEYIDNYGLRQKTQSTDTAQR